MSKKSKALGIHDPLLLQEHPRPRTRREFVAQSFMTGAGAVIAPTLAGMLAYPRAARATLAHWIGEAGDAIGAWKSAAAVVEDAQRVRAVGSPGRTTPGPCVREMSGLG